MINFSSFLCLSLLVNIVVGVAVNMPKRYEFNDVLIEPIRAVGLRISIPNLDKNIKRFSFHGNIDDDIDVADNGTLNKSCFMEIKGRWTIIFEDTLLYKNDIINYWFEVQINSDIYRYRNRYFKVTNLIHLSNSYINTFPNECKNTNLSDVKTDILETSFNKRFESLVKDVEILKKIYYEHIKKSTNTKLILIGIPPKIVIQNATKLIQNFLNVQLSYYTERDEEIVYQVNKTKCGIVFEMQSDIEKQIILFRALDMLNNTNYKLVDYENYNCNDSIL